MADGAAGLLCRARPGGPGRAARRGRGRTPWLSSAIGGVRAYSETCIRVDCPGGEVCIEGERLTLEALSRAEVSVRGQVRQVTLHRTGG